MIFGMHQNKHVLYYNRLTLDGIQTMVNDYVDSVLNTNFCASNLLEHFFASGSTTGLLNIWDVSQLAMISQIKIHNSRINRLQFHPTSKSKIIVHCVSRICPHTVSDPKLLLTASQDGYAKVIMNLLNVLFPPFSFQ